MNVADLLPLLTLASSLVPGIVIFLLREDARRTRTVLNLAGAVLKLVFVAFMLAAVARGERLEMRLASLAPGFDLLLRADAPALLFVSLSALLWLVTTVYAIGYLEDSPFRRRFFGFFSLCVTATVGVALAGNLLTLLLFYELLTVSTYPLVVHRGTPEALGAGRVYLYYTVAGGAVLLAAIAWLTALAGPHDFVAGGYVAPLADAADGPLRWIFALFIAGFGVKAVLVPFHGWLPRAMIAPAPVSALLHAVAVVKVGAFAILRVAHDVFGIPFAAQLGVLGPLALLAGVTVLYGSVKALGQDELKKRLAYSTVAQIALIVLGIGLATPLALAGGLVHLVHHALLKITLFLCAGNVAETMGLHRVSELDGLGRRMPWTAAAFTAAALGLMGVPVTAGFVSKWYLGAGALAAGAGWALAVIATSSLMTAAYMLPVLHRLWFREVAAGGDVTRRDARPALLVPVVATALLATVVGLMAATKGSPFHWVTRVIAIEGLQ